MELTFIIIVGVIFTVIGLICVLSVLVGLPGAWIMLAFAAVIEVADTLYLDSSRDQTFNWWLLGVCVFLALVGELFEFIAGMLGAKTAGSSKRGMIGALVGGLVGAIAGMGIPIPLVGSLVGAVAGTFIGAIVGELSGSEDSTVRGSLRPATGATIGRILGTISKVPIAFVIWMALAIDVFWF